MNISIKLYFVYIECLICFSTYNTKHTTKLNLQLDSTHTIYN